MGHAVSADELPLERVGEFVESLPVASVGEATEWLRSVIFLPNDSLSKRGEAIDSGRASVRAATLTVDGNALPVAVKEMSPMDSSFHPESEVGLALRASLQCALVPKFYGCVKRSRALFMVMERCGGSLADRLRGLGGKGLPLGELACSSCDISDAVAQLHACGIVHCDVKPGNCLVRRDGRVVLTDFDAAHVRNCAGSGGTAASNDAVEADHGPKRP